MDFSSWLNPTPKDIEENLLKYFSSLNEDVNKVISGDFSIIFLAIEPSVKTAVWPVPDMFDDFEHNNAAPGYLFEPPIIKWEPNLFLYYVSGLFGNFSSIILGVSAAKLKFCFLIHFF